MTESGNVFLCSPSVSTARKIMQESEGKISWAYFGEDISKAVSLEKALGERGERIEIADLLQGAAESLRQPYIGYVGDLNLKNHSLVWWARRLSEKKPSISKAFQHICYLDVCRTILENRDSDTIALFVEAATVRKAILKNSDVRMRVLAPSGLLNRLHDIKQFIVWKSWFLLSNFYRLLQCRIHGLKGKFGGKPVILIHTWLNKNSFDSQGAFREGYFGNLPAHLEEKGKNVVLALSSYSGITSSFSTLVRNIKKSDRKFLVSYSFLSFTDILRVLFTSIASKPPKRVYPVFEGMQISDIVNSDLHEDWLGINVETSLLFYHLVKRMRKNNVSIDTAVYTFENHNWEKLFCTALRKYYPSAHIIGHQHATLSRMYLNYFFSEKELEVLPLPDRIVTAGEFYRDLLAESGYPGEKLMVGGAIKYQHLFDSKKLHKPLNKGAPTVLVTPSLEASGAELILKTIRAFSGFPHYRVLVKCHPATPFTKMQKYLHGISIPDNVEVTNEHFNKLLKECDVLIYTGSTTAFEALSSGIPAVHVESDLTIDLDPLDLQPSLRPSVRSARELRDAVDKLLNLDDERLRVRKKTWTEFLHRLFSPVNETVFGLFSSDSK